ncbi:UDP-N-acetylmuramoylalanine--D-glutamate ligase [Natranaerovirga hydrolytica]|uniref:UDP-N-acetylmuramoylalanine--D-glutamate ligase n=1 Tax=Natranaerovirga hydrolytica TaxID=680378 RepID=A0A4R1MXD6_9FIRM|nr:UDP-N-acetylmuramoyl-L-alanine--D-glutamate ligase [Natranaerovirga hydrolytica]TCK97866.1 UDP-N-acetylmuramoylalanine--D-glutamate ligase [Natranaerovirga hydrolytica]
MNCEGKNVLVIGLARSGIAAVKLLYQLGAHVTACDNQSKDNLKEVIIEINDRAKLCFGPFSTALLDNTDLIILSPGVPTDLDFLQLAHHRAIPVWSELELAYRLFNGKLIAITGTNGKTTTTTLVGDIMKAHYDDVYIVGNIGLPFSEIVLNTDENTIVVAEVSSFQLETIKEFKPEICAILNITPDHLNRHKTMENYIETKRKITKNQKEKDIAILNYDDQHIRNMRDHIQAKQFYFSRDYRLGEGVFLDKNKIKVNLHQETFDILDINQLQILGEHNIENVMAAIAIAIHMNVPKPIIQKVITSFKGVEHRIEYVTSIHNINFYNDSKATNPDAAIKGIEAMVRPTVLIAGGMDKGSDFTHWIQAFNNKVKYLVLFGETKYIIQKSAKENGFENVIIVRDLEEAVRKSFELAQKGDAILLSPACASWDMYKSYEVRGNIFKDFVVSLGE